MHAIECRPGTSWRDWWPEGAPSDVAMSSLPTAGATTNPVRLPGTGPHLAFWGDFAGLRIAVGASQSFPQQSGTVITYPTGVDLFLSADTGNWGTVTFARFLSREAAEAWVRGRSLYRSGIAPSGSAFRDSLTSAVAVAGGAQTVATNAATRAVLVLALKANAASLTIGPTGVTAAFTLAPGESASLPIPSTRASFGINGTAADNINVIEYLV